MSVEITRLSNGFRVVTERMPSMESAAIGIWVGAGGRHEAPEQNGIAHFLEHMAFKGTARRSALQIAEEIEDVGGYINAYTSREVTAYYARVLRGDVPLAVDLISDIVLNPVFDAREIEVERGVILQEIGQALDTPDDIIFDWLQEAAYPEQSMGRTILGPSERVSAFSRADLTQFVSQHYGPGQMILSAAGAVDHDAIVRQAEKIFGGLPAIAQSTPEVSRFLGGEARRVKDLEQAHLALGFAQPGYRDEGIYTAQIFASALGGGMSSRLFQEAREKRGLCYSIFASVGAYSDTGLLTIYAGTAGADVGDLARLTMDELGRAAEDMSEAEVARARAQMKSGMLMGLESPSSRAERLARVLAVWDRVPPLSEVVEKIDAVDAAAVRAHAARLAGAAPALALYGPVQGAPDVDSLRARLAA
ncbi:M16 family metallopeptidase [Jannaschia seohaensis]|uniref:Predicted Zn-dependent peptidase n=1 Tax=Jannaschia seohaensis TaxID=475081 RepID=A0A2Y9A7Q8_9RHOB|nr:pitrilysin family protein [Jannaschia seohaensis]PWJ22301.1 putative Zn-dependent peptidase [Jannaschia seohaensis]SSA38579.1 Predicted Zn-dependent peptidase [Jannaschia seohaensis]